MSNGRSSSNSQRSSDDRSERSGQRRSRRFIPRRTVCVFCTDKGEFIDYKRPDRLRRFISDRGKIKPSRRTGTCARHQRRLAVAIKRARHLALLPYVAEHLRRYG